ncbi:hypothetical protein N0V93_010066 [Gnomoniopsis smithogilvyi]|uniref:Heterokaryon incompatibility domain-containing protein n=1 Tax=Gnomoniopsis smithogilvyi TaxID=1191159 RepID=A0A9W8YI91_9PEZI|nr:hypothetical protein N0V93_010066 [Gnomoniopsis smithogilvyi]
MAATAPEFSPTSPKGPGLDMKHQRDGSPEQKTYIYEHLTDNVDHIRCLNLAPGEVFDGLTGTLETINISQAEGAFEAISYVWGPNNKNQTITINGKPLAITTNLRDVLRQARHLDKPRLLWVDAICIDQENSEEKGHQVKLMGQIYRLSRCTLICLSDSTETRAWSREVEALIKDVNEMMERVFRDLCSNIKDDQLWNSFPYPGADDPLISDERWQFWNELIDQPWFSRGWVVQEAALGPECLVLLAGLEIPWLNILRVHLWLNRRSFDTASDCLSNLHARMHARRRPEEAKTLSPWPNLKDGMASRYMGTTILEVLHHTRVLRLSDPKDRIYAVMEYPTSDGAMIDLQLQPRYGKDVSHLDVYREFATEYLMKKSNLHLLDYVLHDEDDEMAAVTYTDPASGQVRGPSFPSWIPRWDRGAGDTLMGDADDRMIEPYNQEMTLLNGESILKVRGVIIDSAKYVSKKLEYTSHREVAVATVVSLWRDFTKEQTKYPSPHKNRLGVAFLNMLCLEKFIGEKRTWNQALKTFGNLLQSDSPDIEIGIYTGNRHAQLISAKALQQYSTRNRFFILGRGYYGVSSIATREGDVCAIIFGTRSPFILREMMGKSNHYVVVGAARIQSAVINDDEIPVKMGKDEYSDDWKDWDLPTRDLFLC